MMFSFRQSKPKKNQIFIVFYLTNSTGEF